MVPGPVGPTPPRAGQRRRMTVQTLLHGGVHPPGVDRGDPHLTALLLTQGVSQGHQPVLGRRVQGLPRPGVLTGPRVNEDDQPLGVTHSRQQETGEMSHRHQVQVQHVTPPGGTEPLHDPGPLHPRGVDQDVQALHVQLGDRLGQIRVQGQIHRTGSHQATGLPVQQTRQVLQVRGGTGQQDEVVVMGQVMGHGQPDPTSGTRDQGQGTTLVTPRAQDAAGGRTRRAARGGVDGVQATPPTGLGGGDRRIHWASRRKGAAPSTPWTSKVAVRVARAMQWWTTVKPTAAGVASSSSPRLSTSRALTANT